MKNLRLYPPVKVVGQDFTGVKSVTVPHQSMTLKEIIKRFIRKESLPLEKQGFYSEKYGDLEKMQYEDITVQMERAEDLKAGMAAVKDREKKAREKKAKESPSGGSPPPTLPVGTPPAGTPDPFFPAGTPPTGQGA